MSREVKQGLRRILAMLPIGLIVAIGAGAFAARADDVRVPSYFDTNARIEKPNLTNIRLIRFATGEGYPPFHYTDPQGRPVGFAVDIAKAVCVELGVQCTMQAWRWDALFDTIESGRADAIIAMVRPIPELWDRFTISERFHQPTARFVAKTGAPFTSPDPQALAGRRIGVLAQTGFEDYLRKFYPNADIRSFAREDDVRAALRADTVDLLFGDSVALALWLNGSSSENCCHFVGEGFVEARYFGEGIGVLTAKNNEVLSRAISYALRQMDQKRIFAEIYLRNFPLGFY
jgi:polar amino acid transport system substrate-binding protein